jgi:predicted choloylglycine hydrolase
MTNDPVFLGFSSQKEDFIGQKLALMYEKYRPAYHRWFSRAPEIISAKLGREKLQQHMPEIVPSYDNLCHALRANEQTCSFLSLYNPPIFRAGCSQACKTAGTIELVRNYDFPATLCDRTLLQSNWNGTKVIAMTDCLWGVLDGMNEHGLAVSLAYGGRNKHGNGFAITLVLRYILEFCHNTMDAVNVLKRVPVHMAYNITLVDRSGVTKTIMLCPEEEVQVTPLTFATNHQNNAVIEDIDAIADSYSRQQFLSTRLADPNQQSSSLVELFLQPPLLRKSIEWQGWGTIYTARYLPSAGLVELHWPNGQVLKQSFDFFVEKEITVTSSAYV